MINLEIENFQNIKQASFSIKGLTCLVGESNIGKTSICRALHCLVSNPPAAGYIRHGAKEARVKAIFPDKKIAIEWIRSKSGARYIFFDSGKIIKKTRFDNPGRSAVPDPIRDLKLLVINTGDISASIGYADQHHYSFLIDDPKLTVQLTGELQAIARLSRAMKQARSETRGAGEEIKLQNNLMESATKECKQLEGSDSLSNSFQILDDFAKGVDKQQKKLDSLRNLEQRLSAIKSRAVVLNQILKALKGVDKLGDKVDQIESWNLQQRDMTQRYLSLQRVDKRLRFIEAGLKIASEFLSSTKTPSNCSDLSQAFDRLCLLNRQKAKLDFIQARAKALTLIKGNIPSESVLEELDSCNDGLIAKNKLLSRQSNLKQRSQDLSQEQEALNREIKEIHLAIHEYIVSHPECPECGQSLPDSL